MKVYKIIIFNEEISVTALVAASRDDTALIALGRYIGEEGQEYNVYFDAPHTEILVDEIDGMSYDGEAKCIFATKEYIH